MQEIKREVLVEKAKELLSNGTVDRVLGWKRDEDPDNNFDWNITPAIFRTAEEIDRDFVWNDFCGANFSKYLIKETIGKDAKGLVFLKPCDTYYFNQLLTEHRFDREKVYAVGVPCNGMVDINKIKAVAGDDVTSVDDGENLTGHTLYDGNVTIDAKDVLPDRCLNCKSKKHVAYDELLGEDGEVFD